jgi:predicted acylesterase/phospholipase RssA
MMKFKHYAIFKKLKPFFDLEVAITRDLCQNPDWLPKEQQAILRYALSFAQLSVIVNEKGQETSVLDQLADYRQYLTHYLSPFVNVETGMVARRSLLAFIDRLHHFTVTERERLLKRHVNNFSFCHLEKEVCEKSLVVVLGGGGGVGHVYLGAFTLLAKYGIVPHLIVGTSIGAIIGLFRSRSFEFDPSTIVPVISSLNWNSLLKLAPTKGRYGLPATLRLYLQDQLGRYFRNEQGEPLRLNQTAIPILTICTGIQAQAFGNDLHPFTSFDQAEAVKLLSMNTLAKQWKTLSGIMSILMKRQQFLREVVMGRDGDTANLNALDAIGFSAAVPGAIHYDIFDPDQRTERILDSLFRDKGLSSLVDGGLVNNVASRVAFEAIHDGRIRTRNCFILAMDAFAPQLTRNFLFQPIQQLAQYNVEENKPFAHLTKTFSKVLSPINLIPSVRKTKQAVFNGYEELREDIVFINKMLEKIPGLDMEYLHQGIELSLAS